MDNDISNDYISNAIDELLGLLSISEDIDHLEITHMIHSGDVKKAIKKIAEYLNLPIDVNIITVPNDYKSQDDHRRFYSSDLAKTSKEGVGGIVAQVYMPSHVPLYGSPSLSKLIVNVKISENAIESPVSFISIMAHELTHVLFHSLAYKEKNNEIYTDLATMMLGFRSVYSIGREVTNTRNYETNDGRHMTKTSTVKYGYLSDSNFDFAINKMDSLFNKFNEMDLKFSKKLNHFSKLLSIYQKNNLKFRKFVNYLANNLNQKIRKKDTEQIVLFFQPNFIDNLDAGYQK